MIRYLLNRIIILLFFVTLVLSLAESGVVSAYAETGNEVDELKLEAEEATLSGLTVQDDIPGYSGTGYVGNFTEDDAKVTFTMDVPDKALYNLTVGYGGIYGGGKHANIHLNGEAFTSFELGEGFGESPVGKVLLNEGTNTIAFTPNWTHFAIDFIKLSLAQPSIDHEVKKQLINPNATTETKTLFSYLVDNFGKNIISGQQDDANNDLADVKYIKELTGKTPAILGLDLMDYSPSRVERGAVSHDVDLALEWSEKGGIVAFAWHWNAPKDLLDTEEQPWWSGFYTDATTFDVEYAMNHPESEDYQLLIRDIDAIAEQLRRLQEENVPVLWRPLHEAEGGWFWWGAKGPEPTIKLWKVMYDRLTNYHELNNLIWVWNSVDPAWYPGDDYVDIVSFDSYPGAYNYSPQNNNYEALVDLSSNKKLIAMTENGPIPDPDMLDRYHSMYSYFTTWIGLITENNSKEHLQKVYNHEKVITLEELPDLTTYGQEKSSDTSLQNLTVSTGQLSPGFSKNVKEYTLEVEKTVDEIILSPVANSHFATVTINGNTDLTKGIKLQSGDNIIHIEVTAEDGTKSKYLIRVKRLTSYLSLDLVKKSDHYVLPDKSIENLDINGLLELKIPKNTDHLQIVFNHEQMKSLKEKNNKIHVRKDDLRMNYNMKLFPSDSPLTLSIERIEEKALEHGEHATTKLYDLRFEQNDRVISQFSSSVQLSFLMKKPNDNQKIYYWNIQQSEWIGIGGKIENKWITAETDHFTIFSVFDEKELSQASDHDKQVEHKTDANEQPSTDQKKDKMDKEVIGMEQGKLTTDDSKKEQSLPNTATSMYNWLVIGGITLLFGIGALLFRRLKRN